jgi:hypothetical protein
LLFFPLPPFSGSGWIIASIDQSSPKDHRGGDVLILPFAVQTGVREDK